jgi:hypothetical protein
MLSDLSVFCNVLRSFAVSNGVYGTSNAELRQLDYPIQDFNSPKEYQDAGRRGRVVASDGGTRQRGPAGCRLHGSHMQSFASGCRRGGVHGGRAQQLLSIVHGEVASILSAMGEMSLTHAMVYYSTVSRQWTLLLLLLVWEQV